MQTVAATFLGGLPRFEGRSSVRTFLFGIMRRKAAEVRRRARRLEHEHDALEMARSQGDAESGIANADLGRSIEECIEQLPPESARCGALRFQEERETGDVGRMLGVSANHVGVLIHRAREHLRDCVGSHGFLP